MNSSNNTQTQPISPRIVVERQRRALAEHSRHGKTLKKFRKHLSENLTVSLDLLRLDLQEIFLKDAMENPSFRKRSLVRKAQVNYYTSLIKKDKVNSIINYKKYQTSLSDWLEYAMENLLEGETLKVADICKQGHSVSKKDFEVAVALDSKGGYWK